MKITYSHFLSLMVTGVVLATAIPALANQIGPNVTISFEEHTAALTSESKTQLKKLIQEANAKGKIDEIQVAAWSDNPAPRENEQLSKADRDLASKRSDAVQNYLKKPLHISDVETYNMADKASWLARSFNMTDAKLKADVGRGGDNSMSAGEFKVYKDSGKPSKAVVLVILKG